MRAEWTKMKAEVDAEIAAFRRKCLIFKYEMSRKIAPETVIFQIGNRISAKIIDFQIGNGPQNRGFSTKNIDFQMGNERLNMCEPFFKIDHRKFRIVQIETRYAQKKLLKH